MEDEMKCDLCGGNPESCGCEEKLVHHFDFEGGPLDGCSLKVPGNQFIVDLFVAIPAKMSGDEADSMTGETIHQYTVCSTSRAEGDVNVNNYMGHVASRVVPLRVVNRIFQGSQAQTEENKQWIEEIEKGADRIIERDERGFDINDDETDEEREEDGDGWKHT